MAGGDGLAAGRVVRPACCACAVASAMRTVRGHDAAGQPCWGAYGGLRG